MILRIVFTTIAGVCVLLPILGTFTFSIPEWLVILPIISLLILSAALPKILAKGRAQKKVAVALPIVAVIISLISLFGVYCNPYFGAITFRNAPSSEYTRVITAKEAEEDFKAVLHHLRKCHPLFIDGVPDEYMQSYNAAVADIRSGGDMTVNELRKRLSEFLAPLHDAHTSIYQRFSDERYLVPDWGDMSIVSVNGITRDELRERAKNYSSYEVEEWISVDLGRISTLYFYGIEFPVTFELADGNGNTSTVTYTEDDYLTYDEYIEVMSQGNDDTVDETPFVYYEVDPERSLAVLTLNSCTYNNEYKSTLRNMFEDVKAQGIKNVAVDLRQNGGGNSLVADEFIKYLPIDSYLTSSYKWRLGFLMLNMGNGAISNDKVTDLTFSGDVYVLTSLNTFSSAMLFAEFISDNSLGTVIGEPPANAANSYGDITIFLLPNSHLRMSCSTKIFRRASGTDDILVEPDIPCNSADAVSKLYEIVAND